MVLAGRATPSGTLAYRDRSVKSRSTPPGHFREAPGELRLSSLGLGTYLGAPDGPTDLAVEEATGVCLASGYVNVLDTAINYRYQRAERSVGRALARAVGRGAVRREEVFVATKHGYLAPDGESAIPPRAWVEQELVRPGILDPAVIADGSHAMSRSFLTDQLRRSLANLGLETIDLLYLHNAAEAEIPAVGREVFFERLEEAFTLYERCRDEGKIAAYGLATWDALRQPRGAPGHLSLEMAVRIARKVGGDAHGLRFVQFPFSLSMPEAWSRPTQELAGARRTVFDAASRLRLGCFTSAPLAQGRLARGRPRAGDLTAAQAALQFARSAPGSVAALVGQKQPAHLAEDLGVARIPPLEPTEFTSFATDRGVTGPG